MVIRARAACSAAKLASLMSIATLWIAPVKN